MATSLLSYEAPKAQVSRSAPRSKTGAAPYTPENTLQSFTTKGGATENGTKTPSFSNTENTTISEVLDAIFPPRSTERNGILYTQRVSRNPATNLDVIALQDRLDRGLQQQQARETGLCPIRSQLYTEALDEIIRQIALSNADRGLLLLRVRNEIRMTIASYQAVYESAIAFGMRSALQQEVHKRQLGVDVASLQAEITNLREEVVAMGAHAKQLQSDAAALRHQDLEKHNVEIEELQLIQDTLMRDLEANLATKK